MHTVMFKRKLFKEGEAVRVGHKGAAGGSVSLA